MVALHDTGPTPSSPTGLLGKGLVLGHQRHHTCLQGLLLFQQTCRPFRSWWHNRWPSSFDGLATRNPAVHPLTHLSLFPRTRVGLQARGLWHPCHLLPRLFLALLPRTSGLTPPSALSHRCRRRNRRCRSVNPGGGCHETSAVWLLEVPDHADGPPPVLGSP